MKRKPWCVAWLDQKKREQWCATKGDAKPDPRALSDETACAHFVTMRCGSERRKPTCVACLVALGMLKAQPAVTPPVES